MTSSTLYRELYLQIMTLYESRKARLGLWQSSGFQTNNNFETNTITVSTDIDVTPEPAVMAAL